MTFKMSIESITTKEWANDTFKDKSVATTLAKFTFLQNEAQRSCLKIIEYVVEK